MIFFGLIIAEGVPLLSKLASPAQSERLLTTEEQNIIMSILQKPDEISANTFTGKFLDFNIPADPSQVSRDAVLSSGLIGSTAQLRPLEPLSNTADGTIANDILASLLPPVGSDLYYAYQDGGKAWYGKGTNVLVILPNESIRSFDKTTGQENAWLQDRLAYPPISDTSAYENYQKNYNAEIVAQTTQWVLMEFPSGGVVKVMKPQYTTPNTGGGTIYGLPNILPGYDN
ncbi:MAG: hypothetical protein WC553_02780 [Patescibacteria group bacterium]|jgi:hypothetical protein